MKKPMTRWISFLLAMLMLFTMPMSVLAIPDTIEGLESQIDSDSTAIKDAKGERDNLENSIEKAQKKIEAMENSKKELTSNVIALDEEMTGVANDLFQIETLIEAKKQEIETTREDLALAKINIEKQYSDMKIRIKFMYEHGTMSYIQILLSASSFSDLLNKAVYIEELSKYDRQMLDEFEDNKVRVEKLEKDLETQQEALELQQEEISGKKQEMSDLIAQKTQQISDYEDDIANKEAVIEEYEAMIEEQDATIKALEAAVAAAKLRKKQLEAVSDNSVPDKYTGGAFCWPAPSYSRISDEYGWRMHPTLGVQKFHNGLDLAAPSGSSILAAADGEVVAAAYSATMGNYIMIDHGGGLYTIYMHASALYVSTGQSVKRGSTIAAVGSTGRSTGPHLHFGVRLGGNYVSPWGYL